MKTKFFWILVIFFGLFFGCDTQKNIPVVSQPVVEEQTDSIKPFEQKFRPKLKVEDSIRFYNGVEIKILKSFNEEYNFVEDGVIYSIDSGRIAKTVPKLTVVRLLDLKFRKGTDILDVVRVYSIKNEVKYIFSYFRRGSLPHEIVESNGIKLKLVPKNPNAFILGGNATLVFRGKEYPINLETENQKCYLLVDYRRIVAEESSDEGWTY